MDQVVAQALAVYRKVLQGPSAVAAMADPLVALEQPARRAASS
jgi:hypothetical protein